VVGAGVVEVYGFLEQAQTQDFGVKIYIAFGLSGNGRYVVQA
jgi:hypothetical protein